MSVQQDRRKLVTGAAAFAVTPLLSAPLARAGSGQLHQIDIRAFVFAPDHLTVRVGDTLRWTNHDLAPHTATALEFGWDSGALERGESFEMPVTAGMELSYFCIFHPHMTASLTVLEA